MRIAQIHNTHGSPLNDVHISYIHNTESAICICIPQTLKPKNIHRHFSVRVIASHIHSIVFLLLALSPRLCASVVLCAVHVHAQNIYTRPTEKKTQRITTALWKFKRFYLQVFVRILIVSQLHSSLRWAGLAWLWYDPVRCYRACTIANRIYFIPFSSRHSIQAASYAKLNPILWPECVCVCVCPCAYVCPGDVSVCM